MVDLGHADEFLIVCVDWCGLYRTKTAESHGSARSTVCYNCIETEGSSTPQPFFLLCGWALQKPLIGWRHASNHSPSRMDISPTLTNQQVGLSSYPAKYEHTSGIHMHPLSLSFHVFCPCLNHVCHSLPFSCPPPRFPSFPGWWPGLTALAQQGRWKLDQLQQAPAVEQPPGNPFWLQHVRQWVSPHIHIFGEDRPLPTVAARYQDDCWKLPHTARPPHSRCWRWHRTYPATEVSPSRCGPVWPPAATQWPRSPWSPDRCVGRWRRPGPRGARQPRRHGHGERSEEWQWCHHRW